MKYPGLDSNDPLFLKTIPEMPRSKFCYVYTIFPNVKRDVYFNGFDPL